MPAPRLGTPDEPEFPAVKDAEGAEIQIVERRRLKMAAGPFGKDEDGNPRGLYRQHCAHCHGVTGDGAGATAAFLNPYPRDYRPDLPAEVVDVLMKCLQADPADRYQHGGEFGYALEYQMYSKEKY